MTTEQKIQNNRHSKSLESIEVNKENIERFEKLKRQQSLPVISIDTDHDSIADDEIISILQKKETNIQYTFVGEDKNIILFEYEEENVPKNSKKSVLDHLIKFFNQ